MDIDDEMSIPAGLPESQPALETLPEEVLEIIRLRQDPEFLSTLAIAALKPTLTLQLFTICAPVFADTCARWISNGETQENSVIEAFARILPLAPHLSTYLDKYLLRTTLAAADSRSRATINDLWNGRGDLTGKSTLDLQRVLLATFRLLNLDKKSFARTVSGSKVQELLQHEDAGVRYLAIRVFCQLRSASDFKLEAMIEERVGKAAVIGDYDGKSADYGFLSLYEGRRLKEASKTVLQESQRPTLELQSLNLASISPLVACYSTTLLPRPAGKPSRPSTMVATATTKSNMESLAKALLSPSPILLHGLAGSGKTSLVNDFACELSMESSMVTLHLNEQTDAKMLIGMYATGATPGSFTWRAGVLTTAVKEGRWVFIEDLDRAPNEVISVILPLIERGELLIPSRGETVKAGPGFRLLASIRTSLSVNGVENPPAMHMLGARLWNRVPVQMPTDEEFREIIQGTHPILHKFLPGIIEVYKGLCELSHKASFATKSRTSLGRPISPRDLLKWCRRLDNVLVIAGSKTGEEPLSEATMHEMFMEAADCFAGSLQTEDARKDVVSCIAENMHIDPQRVEHFLTAHIPRYEETESSLTIGRVRLQKRSAGRITKPGKKSRPFANTKHAKRLLEQVGVAVSMSEPVLLVGETGIGKTTVVQQLADSLGFKLTAVNLSQQSEVGDLLGGFKPVNVRSLAIPLKEEFDELYSSTGLSTKDANQKYLEKLGKYVARSQWSKASRLWRQGPVAFDALISALTKKDKLAAASAEQPAKKRKIEKETAKDTLQRLLPLQSRWERFLQNLDQFDIQLSGGSKGFAFTFVEGNIVKAARNGEWVLLDEINLASPDTLESIADLLQSGPDSTPSILLSETGEIERVRAHPNFRIFGAMNPATDVGKRDLPMGLRSRFTEIYVDSPDRNLDDLLGVIKAYLKGTSSNDERAAHDVARLYMNTKRYADDKRLVDGANQVPHFSLRTLTRVLSYVTDIAPSYGLRRALYEGFAMGFLTLLDRGSEDLLIPLINHHLLESHGNPQALLSQKPRHPEDGKQYVRFMNQKKDRQYWMLQGMETPQEQPHYIITPFVERNMYNLVRATSTRRFPVLVQGPTSSGKTSMIEYLAKFSGNKFVRINNHEHTDLQEYLGTYVSGADGQLRFQEGLLVQALRQGHWIVLDELNLAPTDVLEALNRLLDDNRELLIPETQEIIRPHENFMLFATQNPPGLYGGRKTLSRAFRNRFLELHFDDIPEAELDTILEKRSQKVAPSDCRRIVTVYKELSRLRQSNRLFEQKDSFATLRDLFRWALRDADNREQLATNGYMLLAERVRNSEERLAVKNIIETVMKVKIDPGVLYDAKLSPEIQQYNATSNHQGVVWTQAMRRLYILVAHALRNNEPVLLVGETGCGKTTVCQMLAEAFGKELHIVNAHQNTETGDLIGAQRPVRNRAALLAEIREDIIAVLQNLNMPFDIAADVDSLFTIYDQVQPADLAQAPQELRTRIELNRVKAKALFEWSDGSLVQALKDGQFFLLDEISLADDSVLERLNSVLESQRTILLAEKGAQDSFVQAADGFQFFATMNPGGDYGKRELSPALRNRFTEIWVPSLSEHEDVLQIVEAKLVSKFKSFAKAMVNFAEWFGETYRSSSTTSISVRDVLAWTKFMNDCPSSDPYFAVLHGAAMVYIDTLGANPAALLAINPESIVAERAKCLQKLGNLLEHDVEAIYSQQVNILNNNEQLTIGGFHVLKETGSDASPGFAFEAPTTKLNAMRVVRALQVQKPILIEGSPGVGKTTLIAALARACGKPLTRINLSEQTDLMDLFGSDVPVEGAQAGHFAWRDAPFLQAMQKGEWVLLDEMNLASQSVLEGLNACLDHRGEVYISELDQTFKRHPNFSVFAAQNPHHQGGGRKGLPSSFVNRFTVVYADVFRNEDLALICKHSFPDMADEIVATSINFVSQLEQEIVHARRFGSQGGPWEFNLRDILRWLQLLSSSAPFLAAAKPADFLNLIFRTRFRTTRDRQEVDKIFAQVFGSEPPFRHFFHNMSSTAYQVGNAYMERDKLMQRLPFPSVAVTNRLPEIESVMICVQQNLPCILVGPSGVGKTTLIQHVAAMSGNPLVVFPLNSDVDTMDLVGGFEQVDPQRAASAFLVELTEFLNARVLSSMPAEVPAEAINLLELLQNGDRSSPAYFKDAYVSLNALQARTALPEITAYANTCQDFATGPMSLESARFEWVDGVLIKALEEGKWLVLDNANLCSASVLDRLNSLLEPNGFLSINEHCGPDGEPKIVRPHPNFRIFLTMDARFGELSRAMRNRAIEIFLEPLSSDAVVESSSFAISNPLEASMQRYQALFQLLKDETSTADHEQLLQKVALDNLSWCDLPLLSRFAAMIQQETFGSSDFAIRFSTLCQDYLQVAENADNQDFIVAVKEMLDALAKKTGLPDSFKDAQIIYPLQNSPLVPLLQQTSNPCLVYGLATWIDLKIEIAGAAEALRSQKTGLDTLRPSEMNRLQRSIVSSRVPAVAKDSTVRVANFLWAMLETLNQYLQEHPNAEEQMKQLLQFWWNTYSLATRKPFEEATFQAHLAIGSNLLSRVEHPLVAIVQKGLQGDFDSGFKLTTGLSMETLWKPLRPTVAKSEVIKILEELEKLAMRFDALRWKVSESISVAELGNIMSSLVKAYHLVLTSDVDGASLISTFSTELDKLEATVATESEGAKPFMNAQFEALRQYRVLEGMRLGSTSEALMDTDTIVLANSPSTSELQLSRSTDTSRSLQSVDYLIGQGDKLQPVMGTFSTDFLHRLNGVTEVDLKSLKLLETELPILGQKIASSTTTLVRDQLKDLNNVLSQLVMSIVWAHDETVLPQFQSWCEALPHSAEISNVDLQNCGQVCVPVQSDVVPVHFQEVFSNHLGLSMVAIAAAHAQSSVSVEFSALAWINFAIGCITLFVPDRAFDPDKRQRLERQQHQSVRAILQNKLAALQQFESLFSGQESNLRCQILGNELAELGEPIEILQEVYRPQRSELDQLQGEFNNLLKTVVKSGPHQVVSRHFAELNTDEAANGLQEIKLMQNNVFQIIRRLSERFRAYEDLTAPVVSMLRCLQIGLSLATMVSEASSSKNTTISALSNMTPFLGGRPGDVAESLVAAQPLEYLSLLSTTAATEGLSSFDPNLRESVCEAFHSCFQQWTKKLESDRIEAESKTGLYRFRGSAEDEEEDNQEEFNELFPSYDEDSSNGSAPSSNSTRDTAIALSKVHGNIFLGGMTSSESILGLVRKVAKDIGHLHKEDSRPANQDTSVSLLPGTLLLLDDHIKALSPSAIVPDAYNFYTDANLPEARKLVTLVHQIQARFRELQAVDEIAHMQPLEDVIVSCRELLQFRHTEPLAKIITKVEKVHVFMHEWQFGGWASRANSALTQYDNLTATIVSWRRLELSTWAKLFDMESQKCDDDAKSWWFVAYQVIVAAPLAIADSVQELRTYAQKLLKDLETYFSTAILGQYVQRLTLLKQLEKHLELLSKDYPNMAIIQTALANFVAMYARYEVPVRDSLKRGRLSLEKAMRDILLLASWKDTNIVALRDSAKRSHHKLFKIVRKFRALLGQSMDTVIKQGLPDEQSIETSVIPTLLAAQSPLVDQSALILCSTSIPGWSKKPKRFINVSKTVNMMADTAQLSDEVVEGSEYLESFLANIITSSAEYQKATPSLLTEDNKDTVKHLKARKRKLFSDSLKDLRQMGIKYNLGVNALAKQDSLSVILSNTGDLQPTSGIDTQGLEYYFHKTLDLIPRAREASRQHSDDLSSAEVARSKGSLEGLLQIVLSQRNSVSSAISNISKLEVAITMSKALWSQEHDIGLSKSTSTHEKILRWLPNILGAALELISIHTALGKTDSQTVLSSLSSSRDTFLDLTRRWDALPKLPGNIASTEREQLETSISETTDQLKTTISEVTAQFPGLEFITRQILPWTVIDSSASHQYPPESSISDLDQKLSTVCDTALVAIEKHKKALAALPTSTEDPSWLIQNDTALTKSMQALRSDTISSGIEEAFSVLRKLDLNDATISKAAGAVFALALPILQQYFNILQQNIIRCAQLHRSTSKTSYILAKMFTQIASQGFCSPSEKSDAEDGKTEKLEGGTGLGDGEGAEDISKDIQEDEDLDELAQEPNQGEKQEIEDEQDAVDMADGDMEGEMGDAEEKGEDEEDSDGDQESGDEMDEETGDVDDLDPTAVDEKMWDGDGEQADKDQEGDDSKGQASKDEQVAAQENNSKEAPEGQEGEEEEEEEEEEEAAGAEQGEEVKQDENEKHDPHAEEGEALDLPDDMELDGEDDGKSVSEDGAMDDLSDLEPEGKDEDEINNDGKDETEGENVDGQEDQDMGDDLDVVDPDDKNEEDEGEGDKTEEAGDKAEGDPEEQQPDEQEDQDGLLRDRADDATADADNAVPSDVQGVGEDQDENADNDKTESANQAQRDDGGKGGDSSEKREAAAEDGEKGRQANGDAPQDAGDETQDATAAQPFKKLGDALEKWHRQQTQIRDPAEKQDQEQAQDQSMDPNTENSEFQHLQDEDAEADAQALGTATEEQAHTLDESMAVEADMTEMPETFQPDEVEKDDANHEGMDLDEAPEGEEQEPSNAYEGRAGAMIKQAQDESNEVREDSRGHVQEDMEEDVEEVDNQLSSTHLDSDLVEFSRSAEDAREQWTHYEASTRDLSLSLTEQLRLILAPTLATKMRGDFRTGKRLNIKRIIPYIASQYKRDKIWMRRSVPSKRSYQIMLAVDDSKSMGESGSGSLAFETLVMVSKSLSMLEVGQICVVGFGENVRIAHDFDTPFSSDAGPRVFQNFGFEQGRTNVTKLVRESIEHFRTARAKASGSPQDLWQLELIISDGVCDSSEHDEIRRLLRQALEERIMMVFVVVDDVRNKKKGESVMDLKEAKFVKNEMTGQSSVKIVRYLDTFPFQYYLIVSDVRELPGVLATLLRQWFAEVVDSGN
ncbi:midasin [Coleophoma crateriformis]|uniref:Midasin n=1 Tax=Coleophoma crateriformis TaxID=565419 RepID=A0A3D8QUH7_9HELO|nr:midasin [Coleophoma crateriformis]